MAFGPPLSGGLPGIGGLSMIPVSLHGPSGGPALPSPTMALYGGYGNYSALNAAGFQPHTPLYGRNDGAMNPHQQQQMQGGHNRGIHKRGGDGEGAFLTLLVMH